MQKKKIKMYYRQTCAIMLEISSGRKNIWIFPKKWRALETVKNIGKDKKYFSNF